MNDLEIFKNQISSLSELEHELSKLDQVEIPLTHTFAGGVYLREIFIPKDTIVIGKRHRHKSCNMLLKGKLLLYMGKDEPSKVIEGPLIFESPPGTKKMAYSLEDTIFLNILPTNETDPEIIEKEWIISEEEYKQQIEDRSQKCLS